MPKTGIGLSEILALVAILLPLIPVFIIYILKTYRQDFMSLLMVLCLMTFIQNLLLYIPQFLPVNISLVKAIFQLANFIILMILLKLVIIGDTLRDAIRIGLISFVSVVLTIYCLQGIHIFSGNIELAQAFLLVVITLIALFQLITRHDILIFESPMFWIASGTLFYYSMFFLTKSLPEYKDAISTLPNQQVKILLLIILLVQYIFYIIAAKVAVSKKRESGN